ncbi:Uncharacterized protein FWK35_00019149 [Aphis craccivora]|uniref:Uncharacterized protein n=1 Tax=Aphis craccivora TaxID=307492 RepID=A0A6G0Y9Z9_APHCR|nr:Uncharacterized protein FWK35_00019149 [Aphis craccivora]
MKRESTCLEILLEGCSWPDLIFSQLSTYHSVTYFVYRLVLARWCKQNYIKNKRAAAKIRFRLKAERMLSSSKKSLLQPNLVILFVSESPLLTEGLSTVNKTLGTKEVRLKNQLYTHIPFSVFKEQLLSPEEVAINQSVSLR